MIVLVPLTRDGANEVVRRWHRHHKPVKGHRFAVGAVLEVGSEDVVGCAIVGRPSAPTLDDGYTFEVTRHCTRGVEAHPEDKNVASKLLGACTRAGEAMGVRLMVSYTREDEDGAAYRACGWVPYGPIRGKSWDTGNKADRWLPGFYEPSSEVVDRVRWEWRPPAHVRAVCKLVSAIGRWAAAATRDLTPPARADVDTESARDS